MTAAHPVLVAILAAWLPFAGSDGLADGTSAVAGTGRILAADLLDADGNIVCLDQLGPGLLVAAILEAGQTMSADVLRDLQSERAVLEARGVRLAGVLIGERPYRGVPAGLVEDVVGIPLLYDPERKIPELLGTKLLPQTVVLDAEWRLAATIGLHRASYLRELQRRIQEVLHPWTKVPLGTLSVEQSQRFERLLADGRRLLLAGRRAAARRMFELASRIAPHSQCAKLWLALAARSQAALAEAATLLEDGRAGGEQDWLARGHLGIAMRVSGDPRRAAELLRAAVAGRLGRIVFPPAGQVDTPAPVLEVADFFGHIERPPFGSRRDAPTVLLFWNAGDAASVAALSSLDRCVRQAGRRNVEVVTVHIGTGRTTVWDRLASLRSRLARLAFVPVWFDHTGRSQRQYGVTKLPTLVLVDDKGDVVARDAGAETDALDRFLATVSHVAEASARQNPTTQPADAVRRAPKDNWTAAVRLAEAGDLAGAIAALKRLREQMPHHQAAGAFLAELLLVSDRVGEAEEVVGAGLLGSPSDAAFLTLAGRCALARDLPSAAVDLCRDATASDPLLAAAYTHLGAALARTGRAGDACEALRRALALNPSDAGSWLLLGDTQLSAGDETSAGESFEQAFRLLAADE